jgi:hypothetical protein
VAGGIAVPAIRKKSFFRISLRNYYAYAVPLHTSQQRGSAMTKIRYLSEAEKAEQGGTLRELADRLDTETRTPLPANELTPPGYGGPQRDAINSVIDGIVGDICRDIGAVRTLLDQVEQQVLEGAAKAKHGLTEQVAVCVSVKDEIAHMRRVVGDIQEREKALHDA